MKCVWHHFEIYQDIRREWRWRFVTADGEIIAESSEGYTRRAACVRRLLLLRDSTDAPLVRLAS